ncbi:MAG: RagB/SusD family nutrient uptake outer membrane protein [Muribaculaceae bacterium]|nr:RagB/SusD family nutrient uptake outer membrane protein [Muribaculaceae bacterium]
MKLRSYIAALALGALSLTSCTDLDETVYDQVSSGNYYNTRNDVIRAVFRPFEHGFWSIQSRHVLNELSADQLITPSRDGWWDDGGLWRRYHYHTWTVEEGTIETEWNGCFQGIMQANYVLDDLQTLSADRFGFTEEEFNNLKAQSRVLRAWFYIRLLDSFRNVPLAISKDVSLNSKGQVSPQELFDFIEAELIECVDLLSVKTGNGGNEIYQAQWNKAGAAALLVRIYLNSEIWTGTARFDKCTEWAQRILDGEFGSYSLADRWDAPFDWNNENCPEVIFAFPASQGYTFWHYQGDTYWWSTPSQFRYYVGDTKAEAGDHNCKYACTPSYDLSGNLYSYTLGNTVQKFRNYPEDVRLKLYRNLGNSTREGLFIFGKLPSIKEGEEYITDPYGNYELNIRDAVGHFSGLAEDEWPQDKTSNLQSGDHNSGYHFAKYPFYSDEDAGQIESDFVEIRLAEVIYSLAECKFRSGRTDEAAKLLNSVRKRNYPTESWQSNLYAPEGNVDLSEQELLDEWGREFFAESRRRTDLIRFRMFNSGIWWDKQADTDAHTTIFPVPRKAIDTNHNLIQNPGY